MKTKIIFLLLSVISVCNLQAQPNQMVFADAKKKIIINNRVLTNVNGKAISLMDVSKKMDMQFYRQYPEYADSIDAKSQFYNMYWKHALQELVDKELIMADAEQSKVEVSNGDIRQEMETLFGPNILVNLDTAGLTFDEAWAMVKDDITLKRMLGGKVNALALKLVTPQGVKIAYEEYAKTSAKPDQMCYHVISIRGEDAEECSKIANLAYTLLTEDKLPQEQLTEKINNDNVSLKVSEEFKHTSKEVSKDYNDILASLEKDTYSKPIAQKSRSDQSTVYRIFYLKDISRSKVPSFDEVENRLRDRLIDIAVTEETEKYLSKLRKHYNVEADGLNPRIPEDFKPFALR